MRTSGRQPASTREERERVEALAEEGMSHRRIAEEVFGDQRYRGRVERILRRPPTRPLPEELSPALTGSALRDRGYADRTEAGEGKSWAEVCPADHD